MRISDWSSDVCSSDLVGAVAQRLPAGAQALVAQPGTAHRQVMLALEPFQHAILELLRCRLEAPPQRRACRLERREVVVVLEDEVVDFLGRRGRAGRRARGLEEGGEPLGGGGEARALLREDGVEAMQLGDRKRTRLNYSH